MWTVINSAPSLPLSLSLPHLEVEVVCVSVGLHLTRRSQQVHGGHAVQLQSARGAESTHEPVDLLHQVSASVHREGFGEGGAKGGVQQRQVHVEGVGLGENWKKAICGGRDADWGGRDRLQGRREWCGGIGHAPREELGGGGFGGGVREEGGGGGEAGEVWGDEGAMTGGEGEGEGVDLGAGGEGGRRWKDELLRLDLLRGRSGGTCTEVHREGGGGGEERERERGDI